MQKFASQNLKELALRLSLLFAEIFSFVQSLSNNCWPLNYIFPEWCLLKRCLNTCTDMKTPVHHECFLLNNFLNCSVHFDCLCEALVYWISLTEPNGHKKVCYTSSSGVLTAESTVKVLRGVAILTASANKMLSSLKILKAYYCLW